LNVDGDNVESLMNEGGDDTLEAQRQALVAKIGENIQVRRFSSRGSNGNTVGGYVHMNTIGVLVELEGGDAALCQDVAMHIAAMNPPFATPDDVPSEVLDNERRILSEQALESGKPPEIVEKMVEGTFRFLSCIYIGFVYGSLVLLVLWFLSRISIIFTIIRIRHKYNTHTGRIRKYLEEICVVSQPYVKDGDKTVGKLLEENGAKMVGFTRLVVGEGIEKKTDDFAAEVAAMSGIKKEPVVAA
jgi:elongation factor Ts